MKKILLILAGCLALVLAGGVWLISGAPMPYIPPQRTAAPEGFDPADYPPLDSLASTDSAQVFDMDRYGRAQEHGFLPDLAVTYFSVLTDADESRRVFLDRTGSPIGTITESAPIIGTGPFAVTPDAYYQITATAVSPRRPLARDTAPSQAELERMIAQSTYYLSFAPTDLAPDDPDRIAGNTVHVMQHEGTWKRVASPDPLSSPWKNGSYEELEPVYAIPRRAPSGTAANFFGSRYRVELTHFDQQDYLPERGAPMGSTTGTGREEQWTGTGFYTVFADDRPILRFRLENDREYLQREGSTQLHALGDRSLDFVLVSAPEDSNWRKMVVVSAR